MREWAKYRYGVFDETGYHGDPVYPICYHDEDSRNHVTGCSDFAIADSGYVPGPAALLLSKLLPNHYINSLFASGCRVCSDPSSPYNASSLVNAEARSSIMFAAEAPHVTDFCNSHTHNKNSPTKHNLICDRKSVLEVILQHSDFVNRCAQFKCSLNIPSKHRIFMNRHHFSQKILNFDTVF